MPARYRHFKMPGEIQLGADQSMTPEGGKGIKHVRGFKGGWRDEGGMMPGENGLRWRRRIMDEATNCDEIPRQFGDARRDEGDVQNPRMIPGADRVSEYDWFVSADWPSRGYRYRRPRNWTAVTPQRGWDRDGRRNDRWETVPPVIGTLRGPRAPPSHEFRIILAHRSDTMLESRRHEVTSLRLLLVPSLILSLSFSLRFPLTRLVELRKLPLVVAVASQPFNHRYGSRSRGKLICITTYWFQRQRSAVVNREDPR